MNRPDSDTPLASDDGSDPNAIRDAFQDGARMVGAGSSVFDRPTSVTVFGILNIIFALFGMCGVAFTVAQPGIQQAFEQAAKENGQEVQRDPVQEVLESDPKARLIQNISTGSGAVVSLVLLISGVGLLLMKSWGRTLSIVYSVYDILSKITFTALSFWFIQSALEAQEEVPAQLPPGALEGIFAVSFSCSLVFGLIYPILLLVFMFRPAVTAAFGVSGGSEQSDTMQIFDDDQYSNTMS